MSNFQFNVNNDATIILTAKLERLSKSAFPSAVRATLNDASFFMKKEGILDSAKKNMTVRNPTFFKKYTGVKRADGFNVNSMYSQVGFSSSNDRKVKKALEGMVSNETGGTDSDGAMYMKGARVSGSSKRVVRKAARFDKSKVSKFRAKTFKNGKTQKDTFMSRAFTSLDDKAPIFITASNGSRFLVQVTKINTTGTSPKVTMKFLMRPRKDHVAHAKATHFNREAALKTQKMMDQFYEKNATYQFNKVLKATR